MSEALDLGYTLDPDDVLDAIRRGVENSMPVVRLLVPWTVLPAGAHLWLYRLDDVKGKRGVDVVAMRAIDGLERAEVVTERGAVVRLSDDVVLRLP